MTIVELSEKSGLSTYKIKRLRRPNDSHGLIWRVDEVEALAHAVGFKWPARLELKNERTERAGLPGAADGQRGRNHSEGNAVSAGR